jgi:hypothetical protein
MGYQKRQNFMLIQFFSYSSKKTLEKSYTQKNISKKCKIKFA